MPKIYGRQSLYQYGDNELSLIVFNTESLYTQRHNIGFIRLLRDLYQFTNKQLQELKDDLRADLQESLASRAKFNKPINNDAGCA